VAIARALAIEPVALMLDEPTPALDLEPVEEAPETLRNIAKRSAAMMIVTHEIDFALDVADRTILVEDGGLLGGSPEELVYDSKSERARRFLRSILRGMWGGKVRIFNQFLLSVVVKIDLELVRSINYDVAIERIVKFIRSYFEESKAKTVVVGLSGGLDSSLTATLLVKALGSDNVVGVIMPYRTTPREDVEDAVWLAEWLRIRYYNVDICDIRDAVVRALPIFREDDVVANGNLLPRIRMLILYYFANVMRGIVAGTGDKSEIMIGYFTKWGDGAADFLPIADIYKTQARELARKLGVPERIAYKKSSPRLWEGHTAEGELGLTYEEIDVALFALVEYGMSVDDAVVATGLPRRVIESVRRRIVESLHKRVPIPRPGINQLELLRG